MRDVFVERRLPEPVTEAQMRGVAAALLDGCLGIHRVSWCGSLLSADATEMFCHFRGVDVESVRIAMRQSGAPPGDAWACEVHGEALAALGPLPERAHKPQSRHASAAF